MGRTRADRLLVDRGLAADTDEAARLILAGEVWTGAARVSSPGATLASDCSLEVRRPRRFVSRGGEKLAAGLDELAVDPRGRVCLDAGCSTGGFTDCLLQRGAARVYSVDVGYGQLDWALRHDARVVVLERTNVRTLDARLLQPKPTLIVADLAFISLRAVLPRFCALAEAGSEMVLLVKPQFELSRAEVRDGVVSDPALHERAVALVEDAAVALGLRPCGRARSPLTGPKGNREFFLALRAAA